MNIAWSDRNKYLQSKSTFHQTHLIAKAHLKRALLGFFFFEEHPLEDGNIMIHNSESSLPEQNG